MNKTAKKIVLGITIPAAIAGAIVAGILIYRNVNVKPVPVYALEDLAMTETGEDMSVTSGNVSSEGIQKIFLSGSQAVGSVDVKEGQEVKKGDVLLSYDTTLTQIDIDRAGVNVGRLELELSRAQKELEELNNAQPHTVTVIEPGYTVEYKPSETPKLLQGSGTMEDPYIYLFDESDSITGSLLKKLLAQSSSDSSESSADDKKENEESTESGADEDETEDEGEADSREVYIAIINRENNAMNAEITERHGLRIDVTGGEITGLGFFDPYIPENIESYEEQPQPHEEESGSEYTAEELAQMRVSKAAEIKDLQRNVALAKNEYEQKKLEADDHVVRASIDGVVTKVRSPQEVGDSGEAIVELSAGGAYYVTGTLSEFDLEHVKVGNQVSVESYSMDGGESKYFDGEIVEISDKPAVGDDAFSYFSYGSGNSNVTYYPFKVKLSQDADLRDDSYVEISYQPESDSEGGVYIMNAFIRRDGGDSYVYLRGEKGLLERRSVRLGRSLWGSYTQVKGGLKENDRLAFPYGKDVREGAKTTEGKTEDLYGDMPMY